MFDLLSLISKYVDDKLQYINTVRLAVVEEFSQSSSGSPYVTARPVANTAKGYRLPEIVRVPVVYPMSGGGNMGLVYPLKAGDNVILAFNQESIDEWLERGGSTTPADVRYMDISDAMAIPGLVPLNKSFLTLATENYICLGSTSPGSGLRLEISDTGKIKLGDGENDLLQILSDLISALKSAKCAEAGFPLLIDTADIATVMEPLENALDAIKSP